MSPNLTNSSTASPLTKPSNGLETSSSGGPYSLLDAVWKEGRAQRIISNRWSSWVLLGQGQGAGGTLESVPCGPGGPRQTHTKMEKEHCAAQIAVGWWWEAPLYISQSMLLPANKMARCSGRGQIINMLTTCWYHGSTPTHPPTSLDSRLLANHHHHHHHHHHHPAAAAGTETHHRWWLLSLKTFPDRAIIGACPSASSCHLLLHSAQLTWIC